MNTLFTLLRFVYTWGIGLITFAIFVLTEWYVIYETVPMLITDYGMDPSWGKYIWIFAGLLLTYQFVMILLRGITQTFKNIFRKIWRD